MKSVIVMPTVAKLRGSRRLILVTPIAKYYNEGKVRSWHKPNMRTSLAMNIGFTVYFIS